MASDASTQWWRDSAAHFGFTVMDKTVKNQEDWDWLVASGRKDFQRALVVTGMRTGKGLACLEIGCGVGRLTFALAEQNDFPRFFAAVHPRFRTPYVSILTYALLVWALAVGGTFRWNVTLSAVARLFTYGFTCAALLALRRRGGPEDYLRLPAGALLGVLGLAFSLALALRMGRTEFLIIVVTVVIAVLNWLWARKSPQKAG